MAAQKKTEDKIFRVYSVVDKGRGRDPFWLNLGTAYPHKSNSEPDGVMGFNVILQAVPLQDRDGQLKLVIREWTPEDQAKAKDKAGAAS